MSRIVDVTLHVDEELGADRLQDVADTLRARDGVTGTRFGEERPHLMVVSYDADRLEATELLDALRARGLHGELIGL